jgi:DNA replication and repair protein RecF
MSHGGRALRAFGSQGQQRVALLALLLAEREVLLETHDRAPLMLLDDVMSELDAERRRRLAELLRSGGQALVTATEAEHVPGAGEPGVVTIEVEPGALVGAAA